ncbi:MAG TPA: host attachment family protein [Xanthobacteraceae bacterium]|nr:host attachment family protein [Xanthobacteraceae bacterium]
MQNLKIGNGAWVIVCDGAKALVLENNGDGQYPDLRTRDVFAQENPSTSEQGTDRPGRTHSSVGPGRSAVGQTDWHDQAETKFLKELIEKIHLAVHGGETKELVIVAPPRALGVIREYYTPAIKEALRKEIDKDLVKMPVDQIEKQLLH